MSTLAGYRPLTARDFHAAKLGLFGFLKSQKILITRRPVQRLFFLGFAAKKYIDLKVVTRGPNTERGAVVATVRCFTLFGREIVLPRAVAEQHFFADSADSLAGQRLWVCRPPGAVFALVTFARTTRRQRIGFAGRLTLKSGKTDLLAAEGVAVSRDRTALETALDTARLKTDRNTGRSLLARLIYLWQDGVHMQELAVLEDAEKLVATGLEAVATVQGGNSAKLYTYDTPLTGPVRSGLPLPKWLQHEARVLEQAVRAAGAGVIEVSGPFCSGEIALASTLAAAYGGFSVRGGPCALTVKLDWLNAAEIALLARKDS